MRCDTEKGLKHLICGREHREEVGWCPTSKRNLILVAFFVLRRSTVNLRTSQLHMINV